MTKQADEFKVYSDTKLKLKYELLNKLGEGCFGTVFKAINRMMKRQVALKLQFHDFTEDSRAPRSNISNEIAVLEKLRGVPGVPRFYSAGKWSSGYYMEMELLSSSLHDQKNKEFTESEIHVMTGELIQILKLIHEKGVIHQDLKPQNIMRNDKGSFVIIDFGLSVLSASDKVAYQEGGKKRGFVGTPRYASLAAHYGVPQQPKDDIQSLLYVMATLFLKKAPWFQLKGPASKRLDKIKKYKQDHAHSWLKKCGTSFSTAFQYLTQLKLTEQLNYTYLTNLFNNSRRSKTHQTMKTSPKLLKQSNRRNSDSFFQKPQRKCPGININIHLVDEGQKKRKSSFIKEDNQDISRSHNNFSQLAQDGYIGVLQFLTEKIFNTQDQTAEDSAIIGEQYGREPIINNLAKYDALHFKNPFQGVVGIQ